MLTSGFPFSTQEPFLESEIEYDSKSFDKIIIFAVDLDGNAVKTRTVPDNVDCYNITSGSKKLSRFEDIIKGGFSCFKNTEEYNSDKQYINGNFTKRAFLEYFEMRSQKDYLLCKNILKKYNLSEYDEITIYSYWFFVTARIGSMLKKDLLRSHKNVTFVSRAHGYDVYDYVNKLCYLPLRESLLNDVDCLYPCSKDGKDFLAAKYPEYSSKIRSSYLGTTDMGEASYNTGEFHIVSCSRLVGIKRTQLIIDTLALLEGSEINNLKWTHIGSGPESDKIKKAAESKLSFMEYEFLSDISNDEVYDFYKNNGVNLFLNVSSNEGLPVSIMEAVSFGIPVIAPDVGGVSEIVIDGITGKTLPKSFSAKELASLISKLAFMDNKKYFELRLKTRTFWKDNFNAANNYNKFAMEISAADTVQSQTV